MKSRKRIVGILFLITFTSCVTTIPLSQKFYNDQKVGVIIQVDSIGMAKAGSQGLLDMALTPGDKFREPLKVVESQLKFNETLHTEIANILTSKNKSYLIIPEKIDYDGLNKFVKPNSEIKYAKKDFRNLKKEYNVDEILYIKVKYGILVSYYGVIETGKQGYVNLGTEVINLSDNSLLQNDKIQTVANIDGNWKKGEDYGNLKNAIQTAIDLSITRLKPKF